MKKYQWMNTTVYHISKFSAWSVLIIFLGFFYFFLKSSFPAIHEYGWQFFINHEWNPSLLQFGALGAIKGTLITSLIALIIAIPVSFGITIFILKIAPLPMRKSLRIAIDLLAGIPSIIYGMWGLYACAPFIGTYVQPLMKSYFGNLPWFGHLFCDNFMGIGLFTAGVVLSIMIIPFITSIMQDVFEMVPNILLESVLSLGATTWEAIWYVIVPYGRIGFIGGIMLGLGRALGETMAVSFVIGNAHTMTTTLFGPANSITSSIANEFSESTEALYSSALIELGLFLFVLTGIVVFFSNLLLKYIKQEHGH
jgi:phosphate transport system permease protein